MLFGYITRKPPLDPGLAFTEGRESNNARTLNELYPSSARGQVDIEAIIVASCVG